MQTVDGAQHGQRDLNTVLIVDDDADLRESLRDVLQHEGYAVAVAANGQEALDLLPGLNKPCGIVLDIAMPVMDGTQFYRAMTALPAFADIPVMILTCDPTGAPKGVPFLKKTNVDRLLSMVAALFESGAAPMNVAAKQTRP